MRRAFAGLLALAAVAATAAPPVAAAAERTLELVTPADGNGFNAQGWGWFDGAHAVFQLGESDESVRVAARGVDGWSSTLLPVQGVGVNPVVRDGSDDLSRQIVLENPLYVISGLRPGLYLHETGRAPRTIASWDSFADGDGYAVVYQGRTSDARELFLAARPGYLNAPVSDTGLYRWRDDGSVTPIDTGDPRIARCQAADPAASSRALLGAQIPQTTGSVVTAPLQYGVSGDGRTLALTTVACSDGDGDVPAHVLVVRDGTSRDVTVPVAGSDTGSRFAGMARDGSRVYLTTTARLTAEDTDTFNDLYVYDVAAGTLARVSGSSSGADPYGVRGLQISADGSHAWFMTTTRQDGDGADDRANVFVWSPQGGRRLIAQGSSWIDYRLDARDTLGPPQQLSYDGTRLVLSSREQLAPGFATDGVQQIWRLGADGSAVCASCRRDGVAARTDATLGRDLTSESGDFPGWRLSRDGTVVQFESDEPLAAGDVNGTTDVYALVGDRVELISSGIDPHPAGARGVALDGSVFFSSFGRLVPESEDDWGKLYRSSAGVSQTAPGRPSPCVGDGCQQPPTAPPAQSPPGSETFTGPGDVAAAPLLRLSPIGSPARARLARRGTLTLVAASSEPVRLTATLRAKLGGRWALAGRAARTLREEGEIHLTVKLSRKARAQLARRGTLALRLTVSAPGARSRAAAFSVKSPTKKAPVRPVRR